MEAPRFDILVATCDAYSDTWFPFFKLFSKYWPNSGLRIILTTEQKAFEYHQLDIYPARVGKDWRGRSFSWSERVRRSLALTQAPYLLLFMDDFFLNASVDVAQIREFAGIMRSLGCARFGLTPHEGPGPFHLTGDKRIWEIDRKAEYRVSLQASFWDLKQLRAHLQWPLDPWQLELWGSVRAQHIRDHMFCVNKERHKGPNQIIPYEPSGIRNGKWERRIVQDIFQKNQIPINFSIRGYTDDAPETLPKPVTSPMLKWRNLLIKWPLRLYRSLRYRLYKTLVQIA